MTEFLTWSVDVGRWGGARLRVHYSLIAFAAISLVFSIGSSSRFLQTLAWLTIYACALLIHELGHAAASAWRGVEPDDVLLCNFGNLVVPSVRSKEDPVAAAGGLAVSALLALATAIGLGLAGVRMQLNPFGGVLDSGAPLVFSATTEKFEPVRALTPLWALGWFGWLNWVLFLVNVLPALPLDMGRVIRAAIGRPAIGTTSHDAMIGPWTANTVAIFLTVAAVLRLLFYGRLNDALTLVVLAAIIYSYVRIEAQMLEDGSFFDEGAFGYDFSEGYTSLESSAAKVRPYRESALKRWRRKRTEIRKIRRQANFAAEDRRLDEILDKIHREGRTALTDEENRFLVRVSGRIKRRPREA